MKIKSQKIKKGFTLIELLVVVLIIGILAAIALPQYRKTVDKSIASQALSIIKPVYQSIENYYLVNGEFPESFDELDVEIPWTGEEGPSVSAIQDTRSNGKWSLQLYGRHNASINALLITIISGRYKGGHFGIFKRHSVDYVPKDTLVCGEWYNTEYAMSKKGVFCKELFGGKEIVSGSDGGVYTFEQ